MHQKFKQLLHDYKLEVFHQEHDPKSIEEVTSDALQFSEEVLQQNYRYHFHKLPDANRAEIINMINNYTREALLPPVVEKLTQRQIMLERRFDSLVHLLESMLEVLSQEPSNSPVS